MQIIPLEQMKTISKKIQVASTVQGSLMNLTVEFDIINSTVIDYTVIDCVTEYVDPIVKEVYQDKLDFYGLSEKTRKELELLLKYELLEMKQKGHL